MKLLYHWPETRRFLWLFVGLCCGSFSVGVLYYVLYRKLNKREDEMNMLDAKHDGLENRKALEDAATSGSDMGLRGQQHDEVVE